MAGFVLMHRGWRDNPVFRRKKYSQYDAWGWLIESALWEARAVDVAGKVMMLQRGQLSYSLRFMAQAWKWEKDAVLRFLNKLKTATMITTQTATGQIIVTICNYDKYQIAPDETETDTSQQNATPPRQDRDRTATNNNEGNNLKASLVDATKKKRSPREYPKHPLFPEYRSAMPSRGEGAPNPLKDASIKFSRLVESEGVDPQAIIRGARGYKAWCAKSGNDGTQYAKTMIAFLNARMWEQYEQPGGASQDPLSRLAYRDAYVKWDAEGRKGPAPEMSAYLHLDRRAS